MVKAALQTSLDSHGLKSLQADLVYLLSGVSGAFVSHGVGRLFDQAAMTVKRCGLIGRGKFHRLQLSPYYQGLMKSQRIHYDKGPLSVRLNRRQVLGMHLLYSYSNDNHWLRVDVETLMIETYLDPGSGQGGLGHWHIP